VKKYNLIVAGGGLSGVAAAVCAAREGMSVLLVERYGCLGGALSHNLVYPFMGFRTKDDNYPGGIHTLSAGIFTEMNRLAKKYESSSTDSHFKPEYYKFMLDDLVTEAGVDVLFHASVIEVGTEGDLVKSVKAATLSGVLTLEADFFVDATGNGDVFALAGCDYQLGRDSDGYCQPMTTCFRMSGVDVEAFLADRDRLQALYKEEQAAGRIKNPRENILCFFDIGQGIVHFNTTRIIKHDPTNAFDVSRAEIDARRQVFEMDQFLKKNCSAFANSTIISIASEIGVRESRKLRGVHILTQEELKNLTVFEDSIALGNYDIDIHNPAGTGTSHYYFKPGEFYTIPYRSLLPKEYVNLLVAGRCLSATHEAQASVRIMPICACLGEAAGTAAALAMKSGRNAHTVDIKELQAVLKSHGAEL